MEIKEEKSLINISEEDVPRVLNMLQSLGYIKILNHTGEIMLRNKAINIIEEVKDEFIDKYRGLFKGTKRGCLGTRDVCIKYMNEFKTKNPQYSNEDILAATKAYIDSCSGDNYKYLQQADYFIQKFTDATKTTRMSRLLQWCEEIKNNIIKTNNERIEAI